MNGDEEADIAYNGGVITPDQEYMLLIVGKDKSQVWNLFERHMETKLCQKINDSGKVTYQCVSSNNFINGKYIFMVKGDG